MRSHLRRAFILVCAIGMALLGMSLLRLPVHAQSDQAELRCTHE
jgi:hypothetical protein